MKRILFLSDILYLLDMFHAEYRINCSVLCSFIVVIFVMTAFTAGGGRSQLLAKEHRTSAATASIRDLWCYHCNTMDSGDRCEKLPDNRTDYHLQCNTEKMCMVKSISLTMSSGNSTSQQKLWLLERNCSKHCEPGCIVIGERTKLYACTKCCEASYCNSGKSDAATINPRKCVHYFSAASVAALIFTVIFH